ncbi:MAG TPA: hypothetical protein VFD33_06410, partial [Bacillota bacterium]|nr:hypothetical protein [Bacillota bacterium]
MRSYGNRLLIIIVLSFILCALLITNITRCSHNKKMTTDFYAGRGDKWLATYTIIKTNSMYYETLYIQY